MFDKVNGVSYLIRVQLDQLTVVCLGKGEQRGRPPAMGPCVCDVTHAKEETHLTYDLQAAHKCCCLMLISCTAQRRFLYAVL